MMSTEHISNVFTELPEHLEKEEREEFQQKKRNFVVLINLIKRGCAPKLKPGGFFVAAEGVLRKPTFQVFRAGRLEPYESVCRRHFDQTIYCSDSPLSLHASYTLNPSCLNNLCEKLHI